jgi:lipopolysaccharide export system protein LptA
LKKKRGPFLLTVSLLGLSLFAAAETSPRTASEATITSDELEIRNNGEQTYFHGHVVLKEDPYLLNADQMVRTKATGVVTASGHLDGTWLSGKGEKVKAYGNEGRYDPQPPTTELWGGTPELVRWETAADTTPVHVVADRFIAEHDQRQFFAMGHVVITQKPKVLARSDKANYDQKEQIIHLYGPTRIFVHIADAKGAGDFTAEKGWVTLEPKTAHMAGHVVGHVDPGQTL